MAAASGNSLPRAGAATGPRDHPPRPAVATAPTVPRRPTARTPAPEPTNVAKPAAALRGKKPGVSRTRRRKSRTNPRARSTGWSKPRSPPTPQRGSREARERTTRPPCYRARSAREAICRPSRLPARRVNFPLSGRAGRTRQAHASVGLEWRARVHHSKANQGAKPRPLPPNHHNSGKSPAVQVALPRTQRVPKLIRLRPPALEANHESLWRLWPRTETLALSSPLVRMRQLYRWFYSLASRCPHPQTGRRTAQLLIAGL